MVEIEQVKEDQQGATQPVAAPDSSALEQVGDFRIIREVGKGGMGIVYKAEQVALGRHVALKVLPRSMIVDAQARRRFEREARSAARLHHTNIVPVFGVGEHDGMPYYVMQFIHGLRLDEVLEELKKLQPDNAQAGTPTGGELPGTGPCESAGNSSETRVLERFAATLPGLPSKNHPQFGDFPFRVSPDACVGCVRLLD